MAAIGPRMTAWGGAPSPRAGRRSLALAVALVGVALGGCAGASHSASELTSASAAAAKAPGGSEFIRCLKSHGIARPEDLQGRTRQELAIPGLSGIYGLRVPVGVSRAGFAVAVNSCSGGELHVGRRPITGVLLQRRVLKLRACLAANGYPLAPPDFPGPGPVLDTAHVDVASARWVATATGCYVDSALSKAELTRCMGARTLEGAAQPEPTRGATAPFQLRLLALPRCLTQRHARRPRS